MNFVHLSIILSYLLCFHIKAQLKNTFIKSIIRIKYCKRSNIIDIKEKPYE